MHLPSPTLLQFKLSENPIPSSSYTSSIQSLFFFLTLYFHYSFSSFSLPIFHSHSPSCLITLLLLSFCLSTTLIFLPYQCLLHLPRLSLSLFLSFPCTLPYQTHLILSFPLTFLISPLPSPLNLYHCLPLSPHIIHLLCLFSFHIAFLFLFLYPFILPPIWRKLQSTWAKY